MIPQASFDSIFKLVRLITIVAALGSYGCDKKPTGPCVVFEETTYNCGILAEGEKSAIHKFVFWNKGSTPLRIRSVKTSCVCSVPQISERVVSPGSSGYILLKFDLQSTIGIQQTHAAVLSNDRTNPVVQLTLKAGLKVDLTTSEERLYFGRIVCGDTREVEFDVVVSSDSVTNGSDPLSFESTSPCLSANVTHIKKVRNQWNVLTNVLTCTAKLAPNRSIIGPLKESLTVVNNSTKSKKTMVVRGRVVGNVTTEPDFLFFPFKDENPLEKTISICSSESTLKIKNISVSSDALEIVQHKVKPNLYNLTVTARPEKIGKDFIKSEIIIESDDEIEPVVHIPVYVELFYKTQNTGYSTVDKARTTE